MWRVCLAFGFHRAALYLIALLAINGSLPHNVSSSRTLPVLEPWGLLDRYFTSRVVEVPEVRTLESMRPMSFAGALKVQPVPYYWAGKIWMSITGMSALATAILLSNLFFVLFLAELYKLLNLIVTTDISRAALYLAIFWPTSYELSLGSSAALSCYLLMFCLRKAVEQTWVPVGIASGLLLLSESWFLGVLPLLGGLFYWVQRHFPVRVMGTRLAFFAVPILLAALYSWPRPLSAWESSHGFAGSLLWNWITSGQIGRMFQGAHSIQVLSLVFFLVGAITSLFSHGNWFYRLAPLWVLLCVVLGTPLDMLASHLLIAALCLEGIASLSSPGVNTTIQLGMWTLGIWDVYNAFG